ncbi:MAG: hypothetical protein ACFFBD_15235 [Candidatus Hodarchaeota archaeon]
MSIHFATLVEIVAMFAIVVVLAYISISVYRKSPTDRLNHLFSLATFISMFGSWLRALEH